MNSFDEEEIKILEKFRKGEVQGLPIDKIKKLATKLERNDEYKYIPSLDFDKEIIRHFEEKYLSEYIKVLNLMGLNDCEQNKIDDALDIFKKILILNKKYHYLERMNIWENLKKGAAIKMGFIQLDIEGHSGLVKHFDEFQIPINRIMDLKEDLADMIQIGLYDLEIKKVFWAGDGGLFANICEENIHYDNLIRA